MDQRGFFILLIIVFIVFSCHEQSAEMGTQNKLASKKREIESKSSNKISYGVPVSVNIKRVHPDCIDKPVLKRLPGRPKKVPLRDKLTLDITPEVKIIPRSPTILTPGRNGIPFPEIVKARGKVVPALKPKLVKATAPQMKQASMTKVRSLDVNQGMNAVGVWCIYEDKHGYLWFGTIGGGLSRYDGTYFTHFTVKEGISNNQVRSIYQDSKGNLWFGTWGGGVNKYDGTYFTHYTTEGGLAGNGVLSIVEDDEGNLWFGTDNNGLSRFDGEHFTNYTTKEGLIDNFVWTILKDSKSNLWLGNHDNGLTKFDGTSFTHYTSSEGLIDNRIRSLIEHENGDIWIGTLEGVSQFHQDHNRASFTNYDLQDNLGRNDVFAIIKDYKGRLWFGKNPGGVVLYDGKNFTQFTTEEGLDDNNIWSMWEDSGRNIWFGTWSAGANHYKENSLVYITKKDGLADDDLNSILKDQKGNMWFATGGSGVNFYQQDNNLGSFQHFTERDGLNSNHILAMIEDHKGNLWFGHNNYGLNCFDGKSFISYDLKSGLYHQTVASLLEDSQGNIWIGGMENKITCLDEKGFIHIDMDLGLDVSGNCIYSMLEDRAGNIWFGTWAGVIRYDPVEKNFIRYTTDQGLDNNFIMSIMEDSHGHLWFGTWGGGVSRFKPLAETSNGGYFTHYSTQNGLNNDWILGMIEDPNKRIWINTLKGFTLLIPENNSKDSIIYSGREDYKFLIINQDDGLERTNFSWNNNLYLDDSNQLWWATTSGPAMMDINQLETSQSIPSIHLNSIEIVQSHLDYQRLKDQEYQSEFAFGRAVAANYDSVAPFHNYPIELVLPYWVNHLTFYYSAIDWSAPQKIWYSYKMEGLDPAWSPQSKEAKVDYRNLSPGRYTFKVKAIGASQKWSEVFDYSFRIRPPWWQTIWAFIIYLFTLAVIIYFIYRFQLNRQLALLETRKLKELDNLKTQFYTNITHEFRTPLTVITGIVEEVLRNPKDWFHEGLDMIKRNAWQLLFLVNQMLDLSKLESKSLTCNFINDNIVGYLKYLTESFHSYAQTKAISLNFSSGIDTLNMDYDPKKIETIFENLVGNAMKFTNKGGKIDIRVEKLSEQNGLNYCEVSITDTGVGIPEETIPFIFDRFYQVNNSETRHTEGTGIGLAITNELVQLLDGRVKVASQFGVGSTFTFLLPIRSDAIKSNFFSIVDHSTKLSPTFKGNLAFQQFGQKDLTPDSNQTVALIIEDNTDVARYIKACLIDNYHIELAQNGKEGLEKAIEKIPDIIICDVMMPVMDGFQVCNRLKRDRRTSHIPIVLLTAKADALSLKEGLKYGADAYLIKPFDKEELEIRLQKLLELRSRLKEKYSSTLLEEVNTVEEKDPELLFLKKLEEIVLDNLSNEDFRIEPDLCRAMTMSRPQLYRKLKALTDQSPSDYLRSLRMKEAKKLLEKGDYNINEISERVGFKYHSHFTRVYSKWFGETPTESLKSKG